MFTSVGGKAALLKLALDWALVGDDEPVPMSERPVIAEMQQLTDPRELVAHWARFVAELEERAAPLAAVLVAASDTDPEAAGVHAESEHNRLGGAAAFLAHLAVIDGLRPGLTPERAVAAVLVLITCRLPHARPRARLDARRVRPLDRARGRGRAARGIQRRRRKEATRKTLSGAVGNESLATHHGPNPSPAPRPLASASTCEKKRRLVLRLV